MIDNSSSTEGKNDWNNILTHENILCSGFDSCTDFSLFIKTGCLWDRVVVDIDDCIDSG